MKPRTLGLLLAIGTLAGCATTQIRFTPTTPARVCDARQSAVLLWATRWRPDQKDVVSRELAAARGLADFQATSGCFAKMEARRITNTDPATFSAEVNALRAQNDRTVTVAVRELGPILKVGTAALVEGGTEVVLDIATYASASPSDVQRFSVHWGNGGAGVIKGVASLPSDMTAALVAALQPKP